MSTTSILSCQTIPAPVCRNPRTSALPEPRPVHSLPSKPTRLALAIATLAGLAGTALAFASLYLLAWVGYGYLHLW